MTREALVKQVEADGYIVDFTLQEDCLHCKVTGNTYFLGHFDIIDSFPFAENGRQRTLHTVQSTEHGLTGYYIQ